MKLPSLKLPNKQKPEEQLNTGANTSDPNAGKTPPQVLSQGMVNVRDIIAPSALEVDFSHIKIGNKYYRTLFVAGYPRFVGANWLAPVINFDHTLDISMFYYPVKSKGILDDLRRKITEMEATAMSDAEKGRVVDPQVHIALEDAKALQEQLVAGVEKFFQFSFYITVPADTLEELETVTKKLESTLGSLLLISKTSTLQMEEAFQSTIPVASDKLLITRNMDTTSLATTFPFTSSDLTSDEGIMYGVNMHNGSLVIFDRFSLENANTVVFATSGSGKSFFVKLEALRMMIFGAEALIIDPEEEYRPLCEAVGGNYISFSANSPNKINPFDLAGIASEEENELGQKLLSLHTLMNLMLGKLNPTEEAVMDRALIETFRLKGITPDPATQISKEPPVMEDLYKVLLGMPEPEAKSMAERLEKYIKGSMAGIFDSQSTVDLQSKMTVFSTKNLEETLRPVAFYILLDFIWTRIRKDLKKRMLIVEEAWYLLQNEDSARFIYGIVKRARKYYLGITTITQDVDDFLGSEYGKAIITNSSLQMLLKQHPAAIDVVAETFYLSEGEKRMLLAADVGEGLFFAGTNHIAIKVQASPEEYNLINTNPEELLKLKEKRGNLGNTRMDVGERPVYKPVDNVDASKYETLDSQGKAKPEYANMMQGNQTSGQLEVKEETPDATPPSQEAMQKAKENIEAGNLDVNMTPNMPKHKFPEESVSPQPAATPAPIQEEPSIPEVTPQAAQQTNPTTPAPSQATQVPATQTQMEENAAPVENSTPTEVSVPRPPMPDLTEEPKELKFQHAQAGSISLNNQNATQTPTTPAVQEVQPQLENNTQTSEEHIQNSEPIPTQNTPQQESPTQPAGNIPQDLT